MTEYVNLANVRIAYEVEGTGPWLLFVHGGGLDRRMWAPQLSAFASTHRVLAYDCRGQGQSDAPITGYSLDDHREDLEGLIDALGIERLHLVGLSFGAAIAQAYTVEHPQRIRSLILAGGSATPTAPDPAFAAHIARLSALIERGDTESMLRANIDGPLISLSRNGPGWPLIETIMLSQRLTQRDDPMRGRYPPLRVDPAARVAELRMPVLIIEGERELPGILARGDYLMATLPNGERVRLDDAGHLSNLDQPERFNAVLAAFLRHIEDDNP
ncbi:MAG: alpha/beta fold hydrolase [Dehalococcoidia bacterium]